jgi:two-component system response regulator YesN
MRVLVADDEKWIRKAIIKILPFQKLGLELVGEAANGLEAYEKSIECRPDILLTDIRMPGMSGLELAEKVQSALPACKVVLISGYDDFEYAKTAIKYGVSGYILKPIDEEELTETLTRIVDHLAQGGASMTKPFAGAELAKGNLFSQLLEENALTVAQIEKYLALMDVKLKHGLFTVVVFTAGCDDAAEADKMWNLLQGIYPENDRMEAIFSKNRSHELIVVFNHSSSIKPSDVSDHVIRQIQSVDREYRERIYAGISTRTNRLTTLYKLYDEAGEALDMHFWDTRKKVCVYQDSIKRDACFDIKVDEAQLDDIVSNMKIANFQPAYAYVDYLLSTSSKEGAMSAKRVKELVWSFLCVLISRFNPEILINGILSKTEWKRIHEAISGMQSAMQLNAFCRDVIERICREFLPSESIQPEDKIDAALRYIDGNYHKEFSLEDVACFVGLAPVYFSQLFKRKTGLNFTEYKTKKRIERAKILCQSMKSIAAVSQAVGYADFRYFCKVFKRLEGVSFSAYRKSLRDDCRSG